MCAEGTLGQLPPNEAQRWGRGRGEKDLVRVMGQKSTVQYVLRHSCKRCQSERAAVFCSFGVAGQASPAKALCWPC